MQIANFLVPLIGMNVAQETTRSQALPGNALVWRLLPPEFTNEGCISARRSLACIELPGRAAEPGN